MGPSGEFHLSIPILKQQILEIRVGDTEFKIGGLGNSIWTFPAEIFWKRIGKWGLGSVALESHSDDTWNEVRSEMKL